MNILTEEVYMPFYYTSPLAGVFITALSFIAIFSLLFYVYSLRKEKLRMMFLSVICFSISFALFSLLAPDDKPHTLYTATVEDWNEVYDNGYIVVKQDGELVTLKKYDKSNE